MQAGNRVLLSNLSGPGLLTGYVAELGLLVSAGAVAKAAQVEVVFRAVPRADIGQACSTGVLVSREFCNSHELT
ncbi:hypothetical protein [Hymenobacter volaticus]|uniref:Ferrous iron transport protein A n=1 Tax=Hymenobacter volaticus TaxID=2932254 RepID=A0ABY4GET3_9BACT|nr:hypothetical protein [Hymenobacter volaticus]UOQ69378.1 hypothetical protein MUN86_27180 [Hymenobacter volaticus]